MRPRLSTPVRPADLHTPGSEPKPAAPRGVFGHLLFLPGRQSLVATLTAALVISTFPPVPAQAGDILRGGATSGAGNRQARDARPSPGAEAAQAAQVRAQDRLARTTQAVTAMRQMQAAARAAAGASTIPNGLRPGGLEPLTGANAKWTGAKPARQAGNLVTIEQTSQQALLHWKTFNVGRETTVHFDQKAGGNDAGKWIAFNKVFDPSGQPSRILGSIKADGQVYVINQNGIIFGAGSQVNARTLVASSLPINDNLVAQGLLNNPDAQFLLSQLTVPGGSDGTLAFTPPVAPTGTPGDVVVERGAQLAAAASGDGNGGRILLAGTNVRNAGHIQTPGGQTILAAGLQVGTQAHPSSDPSLRGLDVWIGAAPEGTGEVVNDGLIEAPLGSISLAGRRVRQNAVAYSTTSVALNGRIDIAASYGAVSNPNFDNSGQTGFGGPMFMNQFTGEAIFGARSTTAVVPDYEDTKTVPGVSLPQRSQMNVTAGTIHFDRDAIALIPNGKVTLRAGLWPYRDVDGDRTVLMPGANPGQMVPEPNLGIFFAGSTQRLLFSGGRVFLDSGAILSVAGSTGVDSALDQRILTVQLRGNELADSPVQRTGPLRGTDLVVDTRRSGEFRGKFWVGSPLGDVVGLSGLTQKNVGQLTVRGGDISVTAGSAIIAQPGSEMDVSGGFLRQEAGMIRTTRLRMGANLLDIADATPDRVYDGIYTGSSTRTHAKWGVSRSFRAALAPLGEYREEAHNEGAAAGSLALTAPALALAGEMRGAAVAGERQRESLPKGGALSLAFRAERLDTTLAEPYQVTWPERPLVTLENAVQTTSAPRFAFDDAPSSSIPGRMASRFVLSDSVFGAGGFSDVAVNNTDGDVLVTPDTNIVTVPGGGLTLTAANIQVFGSFTAPGGAISMTTHVISPTEIPLLPPSTSAPLPLPSSARGNIVVHAGAVLNTAGLLTDDSPGARRAFRDPIVRDGGSIRLEGFRVDVRPGSLLDVSAGAVVAARGRSSHGDAGSIALLAGRDPNLTNLVGGELKLGGTLRGYGGGDGGSLELRSMLVQIGTGSGLPGGPAYLELTGTSSRPVTRIPIEPLVLPAEFFGEGGFSRFSVAGIGASAYRSPGPDGETLYPAAVRVAAGTSVRAEALKQEAVRSAGGGGYHFASTALPEGQRDPVSVTLRALGADDGFTLDTLEARADIVVESGASLITDAGGSLALRGGTVTMLGSLTAPGGTITIQGANKFPQTASAASTAAVGLPTVHLGSSAVLSAAGKTVLAPDAYGRRFGTVIDGGTISIAGNIVAERGALLDVSGAADTLDVVPGSTEDSSFAPVAAKALFGKPWGQRAVAARFESNGGLIALTGGEMLFSDATLHGFAGGTSARGGTLRIFSGRSYAPSEKRTGADINLVVTQSSSTPAVGGRVGIGRVVKDASGAVADAMGYFTADLFGQGGFDSLDLGFDYLDSAEPVPYGGNVAFKGPVNIQARGFLRVAGGGIVTADNVVSLSAPYIAVGQPFRVPKHPSDEFVFPFEEDPAQATGEHYLAPPTFGPGQIAFAARHIDIGTISLRKIGTTTFTAANGDIRGNGIVAAAGTVNFVSAQLYPTSAGEFSVFVYDTPQAAGTINVRQSGRAAAPLSAGGALSLYASTISQAGTLIAPFGSITLGWDGTAFDPSDESGDFPFDPVGGSRYNTSTRSFDVVQRAPVARSVTLLSGSVTSVAGVDPLTSNPLVVPFGLSNDGLAWIDPRGVNITSSGLRSKAVRVAGQNVTTEAGSLIDLRGGGELLGYRWLPGPGGSIDLLGGPAEAWSSATAYDPGDLVSFGGSTWSARVRITPADFTGAQFPENVPSPGAASRYWTKVAETFAIIPGLSASVAPYAPYNSGLNDSNLSGDRGPVGNLQAGDSIRLPAMKGLAAGTYTLLPSRYGLLEGAFLIEARGTSSLSRFRAPDGSTNVLGATGNRLLGDVENDPQIFEITPPELLRERVDYATYSADRFLREAALRLNLTALQRLPGDAAALTFHADNHLALEGAVRGQAADFGRGARIDISSLGEIVVSPDGSSSASDTNLSARLLSSYGAESLLLGGLRRNSAGAASIEVRSPSVRIDNAGQPLAGPDILLVAKDLLELAPGADVRASGSLSREPGTTTLSASRTLAPGASLSVSSGGVALPMPAGSAGAFLTSTVAGRIILANGSTQAIVAGTPFTVPTGASLSFDGSGSLTLGGGSSGPVSLGPTGDVAVVRVSAAEPGSLARSGIAFVANPTIRLKPASRLAGASVLADSTAGFDLQSGAILDAPTIALGASQISIVPGAPISLVGQLDPGSLVLGRDALTGLSAASNLALKTYRHSVDLYGSGFFSAPGTLVFDTGTLRGFGTGADEFRISARSLAFTNTGAVATTAATGVSGRLVLDVSTLAARAGNVQIRQFDTVNIEAPAGVVFEGTGSLSADRHLNVSTSVLAVAQGAVQSLAAGAGGTGDLTINRLASTTAVTSGAGGSLALSGANTRVFADVLVPSGILQVSAFAGNVEIGGKLSVEGTSRRFFDVVRTTDAGEITLASTGGSVRILAGGDVSVGSSRDGGNAGRVFVSAPNGSFSVAGRFEGAAAAGGRTGSFSLDTRELSTTELETLRTQLNTGSFFESRSVRVRQGDLTISGSILSGSAWRAGRLAFSADAGSVIVAGDLDARGATGGLIQLSARNNVTVQPGSLLTVRGKNFSAAGKGGHIRLEAGAIDATGAANTSAFVTTAGATFDLGVDAFVPGTLSTVGSSASLGRFTGTLHLRAPRGTTTTVNVNPLAADIVDASSIVVEGFRVYTPAGGNVNTTLRNQIFGTANADPTLPPTGGHNNAFMAGEAAMRTNLLSLNAALGSLLVVAPGVEIINLTGNLQLGSAGTANGTNPADDWDLSAFRYGSRMAPGILTLRAFGNLVLQNALSDGFSGLTATQQAGGISAGQRLWLANLMTVNPLLPTNTQSWSYRLIAGADFSAADPMRVRTLASLGTADTGSVKVGNFYTGNLGGTGGSATTAAAVSPNGTSTRYQVVRTGTGDIAISAARDVQIRNQLASIYTAGVRVPNPTTVVSPNDFSVPVVERVPGDHPDQGNLGGLQQIYPAQWSLAGGNLDIRAQQDIRRITRTGTTEVNDTSRQMPSNWLYRRGFIDSSAGGVFGVGGVDGSISSVTDPSASTTWWIDYSNFFQGFGALGGGDISLDAGRNVVNADAAIPTNARMAGLDGATRLAPDLSRFVELGGGDLTVRAGRNIDGGTYYVERGNGELFASGEITTNSARSPTTTLRDPLTWLATTLFAGRSSFQVAARGSVLLGPVSNAFLLPPGLNNKFWNKSYFQTYAPESRIDVAAYGGGVTHRLATVLPTGSAPADALTAWLSTHNLFTPTGNTNRGSQNQPWIRIGETQITAQTFGNILTIAPPTLVSTAFNGDLAVVGAMNLFPSSAGNLELVASGQIRGLNAAGPNTAGTTMRWISGTLNLSDSDPALTSGVTTPFAYQSLVGRAENDVNTTRNRFLDSIARNFAETGSFTGSAGTIAVKQALHASTPVHRNSISPLRIYGTSGDVTGLTLFSAKRSVVLAQRDVSDVSFYIQNTEESDLSIVSAGRNIIAYNAESVLRAAANAPGNTVVDPFVATTIRAPSGALQTTNILAGDIQISGPGGLQVLAGRDLDLGTGPNRNDGTGVGITSIGNFRNPALPFAGANVLVAAGLGGTAGGPAIGLAGTAISLAGATGTGTPQEQALAAVAALFEAFRNAAADFATTGSYAAGYAAIGEVFGEVAPVTGSIFTRSRDIRTSTGGSVTVLAPGGDLTLASAIFGSPLVPPGIVTEYGGEIATFTQGSVDIGQARIFTLRGGDITMWSSTGDIAAGTASRTVVTAPPTRVVIDATSAAVETDLGGLATGGGIGVLASVEDVEAGSVFLIAPEGTVDAGDAGIRATGDITIAAAAVVNADNISAGGTSSGVPSAPTVAAPNIAGLTSASSTTGAAANSAQSVANQNQAANQTEAPPSIITVEVLGYGGGEDEL